MKQVSFGEFGIWRVFRGRRRAAPPRNSPRSRWYCEGSGTPTTVPWRSAVVCPTCGRMVRSTSVRRIPNHGRAEASA